MASRVSQWHEETWGFQGSKIEDLACTTAGSFEDGRDGVGELAHTLLLSMSMRCYTKMDPAPTAKLSPKVGVTQGGLSCVSLLGFPLKRHGRATLQTTSISNPILVYID